MSPPFDQVSKYLASVDDIERPEHLRDFVIEQLLGMGAQMVSYHHMPPIGAADFTTSINVVAHGFPEDWVKKYTREELYTIDPIPKAALEGANWFFWSEVDRVITLNRDNLRYLRLLEDAQIGEGMAVPVFGPHARDGYVGIGFGSNPIPDKTSLDCMAMIAQSAHQHFCQLIRSNTSELSPISPREHDVLYWVVRGKSNSVIADITGLSIHTVDTHLRKVFRKLDAHDRVTASLRAIAAGLVT